MVHDIVKKYVLFDERALEWKNIDFTSLPLKFKVVRDCMLKSGTLISSADLSNIIDIPTLIECVSGKWGMERDYGTLNEFRARDPIKSFFELERENLPLNMYFIIPEIPAPAPESTPE